METFDIKYIVQIIKKYKMFIFSSALIGVITAACISFLIFTNIYSASTQVLVTQANDNTEKVHSSEVQANIQMVNTYSIILKSKDLLKSVAKDYLEYSVKNLYKKITVTSDSNSQVINVTVTDTNPNTAVSIANNLTDKFIKKSTDLIKTNSVSVLSRAYIEDSRQPSGPNHKIHLIIGLLTGLFVTSIIIVFRELFDTTFKTEDSVEDALQLPILGVINEVNNFSKGRKLDAKS